MGGEQTSRAVSYWAWPHWGSEHCTVAVGSPMPALLPHTEGLCSS